MDRGAAPETRSKSNREVQYSVDKRFYARRARIECFFNKLKNFRRVAARYDQADASLFWLRLARLHPYLDLVCPRRLADRVLDHDHSHQINCEFIQDLIIQCQQNA